MSRLTEHPNFRPLLAIALSAFILLVIIIGGTLAERYGPAEVATPEPTLTPRQVHFRKICAALPLDPPTAEFQEHMKRCMNQAGEVYP